MLSPGMHLITLIEFSLPFNSASVSPPQKTQPDAPILQKMLPPVSDGGGHWQG